MKPFSFEYFKPNNIDEAISLLNGYGEDAVILAGGQSLIPLMNLRLARPKYIIDINKIAELSYIKDTNGGLSIGALTRHREIEKSDIIKSKYPILSKTVSLIGNPQIRNWGTIGGSISHADPGGELPTLLLALNGKVKVVGNQGEREIDGDDLFLGYLTTSIEKTEILREVYIPEISPKMGWEFVELTKRSHDFAIVSVAVLMSIDNAGKCNDVRISLGGVGSMPVRAKGAEEFLMDKAINDDSINEAANIASEEAEPESDIHASAEYRKEMVKVFVNRGLISALDRVRR
ncbi:MAG: xanthine dehydrogenase family protein subunit M [Syntrophales bacterium]|nr:xanthine dehydrogenase family protein subunit M [Syntrophales bacterium]